MSYFDLAIIIIIAAFTLYGLWRGLIEMLLSIIAMVVGFFVAYLFNDEVAKWIGRYIPWGEGARRNLAFILLIIIANRAVGLLFWVANKMVGFLWRLPFINSLNRLLGMITGFVEGIVAVGVILAFLMGNPVGGWLQQKFGESKLSPPLIKLGSVFLPSVKTAVDAATTGVGFEMPSN